MRIVTTLMTALVMFIELGKNLAQRICIQNIIFSFSFFSFLFKLSRHSRVTSVNINYLYILNMWK